MENLIRSMTESRDDLSDEEIEITIKVFNLFRSIGPELDALDTIVVLNTLDLLKEFFLEKLNKNKI